MTFRLSILMMVLMVACTAEPTGSTGSTDRSQSTVQPSTVQASPSATPAPVVQGNGLLSASPDPIQICDGTGRGITTISWKGTSGTAYEILAGGVDGKLFAAGRGSGSAETGRWVKDHMQFTLMAKGDKTPLDSIRVSTTTVGCP